MRHSDLPRSIPQALATPCPTAPPPLPTWRTIFSVLIDARSPAEYALDHLPGAINCPVLDDEERRIVGTTYVQTSAFEARKIGRAMVARNIARHLDELFRDKPKDWRPLIYCWRGGMRSGSFVNWLRLVGWDAQQLKGGGYKAWRAHVIEQIAVKARSCSCEWCIGPRAAPRRACCKPWPRRRAGAGPGRPGCAPGLGAGQCAGAAAADAKAFETQLMQAMAGFDLSRRVWIEAESRRIGKLTVPEPVLANLRANPSSRLRPALRRATATCCATTPGSAMTAKALLRSWARCASCCPKRPSRSGRPGRWRASCPNSLRR